MKFTSLPRFRQAWSNSTTRIFTQKSGLSIFRLTLFPSAKPAPFFLFCFGFFRSFFIYFSSSVLLASRRTTAAPCPPREKNVAPANIFDPIIAVLLVDRVGSSTAVKIAEPPLEPTILPREDGAEWSGDTFRTAFRDVHHYKFRFVFP